MKHENGVLYQIVDKKYANKPCKAYDCDYFENVVVPIVQNEH